MLLDKVLPRIYEKWPKKADGSPPPDEIIIQEDNVKPHKLVSIRTDIRKKAAADAAGWKICVVTQLPNSPPDMNVLDLGFFNSIQNLQYKKQSKDIDHLIENVEMAFDETKRETLNNNVFLALQACCL